MARRRVGREGAVALLVGLLLVAWLGWPDPGRASPRSGVVAGPAVQDRSVASGDPLLTPTQPPPPQPAAAPSPQPPALGDRSVARAQPAASEGAEEGEEAEGAERVETPWLVRHVLETSCELCGRPRPRFALAEQLLAGFGVVSAGHSTRFGAGRAGLTALLARLRRDPPRDAAEQARAYAFLAQLYGLERNALLPPLLRPLEQELLPALETLDTRSAAWFALGLGGQTEGGAAPRERLAARASRASDLLEASLGVLAGVPLPAHQPPPARLRERLSAALARSPRADPEQAWLLLEARAKLGAFSDAEVEQLVVWIRDLLPAGESCDPPLRSSSGAGSEVEANACLLLYWRRANHVRRWHATR